MQPRNVSVNVIVNIVIMKLNFLNCVLLMVLAVRVWVAMETIEMMAAVPCIPVLRSLCVNCANTESKLVRIFNKKLKRAY